VESWEFKTKKIHYKKRIIQTYSFGSGKKKVLALPAFPHSGLIYGNFFKYNTYHDIELITLDLPGWVGDSENIFENNEFSFDECVEICLRILRNYNVKKVSIIGFSFGTAIETLLAYKIRNRIEKLVYVSPFLDRHLGMDDYNLAVIQRAYNWKMSKTLKFYVRTRFDFIYSKVLKQSGMPKELLLEYRKLILKSEPKTLLESIHQLFSVDLRRYLKLLTDIPVLVINSKEENKMFRRNAAMIRRLSKNDKSLYIHGRHEDFLLKPYRTVCTKVLDFLDR